MKKSIKQLIGLICAIIVIASSLMMTPVRVNAAGETTGGIDLNLYTLTL